MKRKRESGASIVATWPIVVILAALISSGHAFFFSRKRRLPPQQRGRDYNLVLFCQLLGMNCAAPTDFGLSWPDFCQRGGATDVHADGWGLVYYANNGLRQFHDVEAASTSPLAQFLGQQKIQTSNMLAHIRYATSGQVDLANVHPFSREMWAMNWSFCHNGQIPLFDDHPDTWLGKMKGDRMYYPVGNTDSEKAFCAILNSLRAEFTGSMPSLPVLHERISALCDEIIEYDPKGTILNFLLACGPYALWVYSYPGKRPGSQIWNGLHYTVRSRSTRLGDDDYAVSVSIPGNSTTEDASSFHWMGDERSRQICIVATTPLTNDEEWIELKPRELILFDEGLPHVSPRELFRVELHGHGLDNNGKVLGKARLEEDMRQYEFHKEFYVGGGI